jgi:Holliday junction resolvase
MNCKAKGNRNERRSMVLLELMGYCTVRSTASLGPFDVIGIGSRDLVLLQVKSNSWPSALELEDMRSFIASPNARKIVHCWIDRRRTPDVKEIF